MSLDWPLDEIRNGNLPLFDEYFEHLLIRMNIIEKEILLITLSQYPNMQEKLAKLIISGANPSCGDFDYSKESTSYMKYYSAECGATPLGSSILGSVYKYGDTLENTRTLLLHGADVNGYTFSGYTPIQLSIVFNQREHAKVLLKFGADPFLLSSEPNGVSAFDITSGSGDWSSWADTLLYYWARENGYE